MLGSGGAIGAPLARELVSRGERVRAVSRSGRGEAAAENVRADLTNAAETLAAVEEGATVDLLIGLPYDARVWRAAWPVIMRNVIAACEAKRARLLFFDNVYMYGAVNGAMTEETPVRPSSEKGEIRAEVAELLLAEMGAGRITALIARVADFYGPYASASSVPQAPDAFGQVWHLPTAHPALTGQEFIAIAARVLGRPATYSVLPKPLLRLAGIGNRQILELSRMSYQNDRDYLFDSSKFERRFAFVPTPYERGIEETLRFFGAGAARA